MSKQKVMVASQCAWCRRNPGWQTTTDEVAKGLQLFRPKALKQENSRVYKNLPLLMDFRKQLCERVVEPELKN